MAQPSLPEPDQPAGVRAAAQSLVGRHRAVLLAALLVLGAAWVVLNHLVLRELRGGSGDLPVVGVELAVVALLTWVLATLSARVARSEMRLRQSEERFRNLAERSPDIIYRLRCVPTIGVDYMSPATRTITGYAPAEFYADPDLVWRVIHPEDVAHIRAAIADPESARVPLILRWRHRDGSTVSTERHGTPVYDAAGRLVAVEGSARDVTARLASEQALRASEERFRRITASITDYVYTVHVRDGVIGATDHGPGSEAVTGYTPAEFAADPYLWLRMIVPDDRDAVLEQVRCALAGEQPAALEHRVVRKDGATRWLRNTIVRQTDAAGALVAFDGLLHDVTEKRTLEEQLRQVQKMEAVGQLAGGIAHDFNNLLTVMRSNTELVRDGIAADDPAQADIDQVLVAADRAADLIRQLQAFSRRQALVPQVVVPADVVEGLLPMLRRLLGGHIAIVVPVPCREAWIKVDPGQLEQIVVNLAVNAADAMPNGGRLTIETDEIEVGADDAATHPDLSPGAYVLLTVSDTGSGMDEETRTRAFEPFFTTKAIGKGTGMGLATVYGIVKQSQGCIDLRSELAVGTTFRIYFPRVPAPAATVAATSGRPAAPPGEGLLPVEDDAAVRGARPGRAARGSPVLAADSGGDVLTLGDDHEHDRGDPGGRGNASGRGWFGWAGGETQPL